LKLQVDDSSDNSTAQTLAVNINQATGTKRLQEIGMPAGQMHRPNAPTDSIHPEAWLLAAACCMIYKRTPGFASGHQD